MRNALARFLLFLPVWVGKKLWLFVPSVSPAVLPLGLCALAALVQSEIAQGIVPRFLLLTPLL